MFLQRKLRFGAVFMIIGCLLAIVGEVINLQNTDVLSSSWHLSLEFIVGGTFVMLIGLAVFSAISNQIYGFGFLGTILLLLGGFLMIVGTVALDWIIVPFLVNLANVLAASINAPAISTQNALNSIINSINKLGGSFLQSILPGAAPHIAPARVPMVNGTTLVNNALVQLHMPTIDKLAWWGRISLTGGPLTIGSLILGLALLRERNNLTPAALLLILCSLLNLLCQYLTSLPTIYANITACALFFSLIWLGTSAWWPAKYEVDYVEEYEEI
jgi:hypothetical protein